MFEAAVAKDVEGDSCDWEIQDGERYGIPVPEGTLWERYGCQRLVRITLRKATPMKGMIMWWDRIFVGDEPVDVEAFPDRRKQSVAKGKDGQPVQNAWVQAHQEFRRKMAEKKAKEKTEADLQGGGGGGGASGNVVDTSVLEMALASSTDITSDSDEEELTDLSY